MVNIDDLKRQYNYIATIQEYYYRLFDQYNNHLSDFISKNIPHLHYNISTALNVIQVNTSRSLSLMKNEIESLTGKSRALIA
ncbi:MAG: hypothetical protein [Bacteriophage sp.]|nr:MAG: hypothetical protein [Bacteriophage sp.]